MYIYNLTFVVEKEDSEKFLQWFRDKGLGSLVNPESPARSPRMTTVAAVPGAPDFDSHASSFAFQTEFPDMTTIDKWVEAYLQPLLGEYTVEFGSERAHCFATVLKEIDL